MCSFPMERHIRGPGTCWVLVAFQIKKLFFYFRKPQVPNKYPSLKLLFCLAAATFWLRFRVLVPENFQISSRMAPAWFPRGSCVAPAWLPRGSHSPAWFPCGSRVASVWLPRSFCVAAWLPPRGNLFGRSPSRGPRTCENAVESA